MKPGSYKRENGIILKFKWTNSPYFDIFTFMWVIYVSKYEKQKSKVTVEVMNSIVD
jgi:hypothetical protein